MEIRVTSAARKPEKLLHIPAAVHVITAEDIRHSGARTLPDALRLAPGVQVAQQNAHSWAITVRGFNDRFANKLLVLVDGRSVYTPLFAGVLWASVDVVMENIDRIEVIRGPAGTMWGANAVNGVINVITKHSRQTQGLFLSAGSGTELQGFGLIRYGGGNGDDLFFRTYLQSSYWDDSAAFGGGDAFDSWWKAQGGFRLDWDASEYSQFMFQGDVHQGERHEVIAIGNLPGQTFRDTLEMQGGNLLGRWQRTLGADSDLTLQAYYDRLEVHGRAIGFEQDMFDLSLQHRFGLGSRQEIMWGLEARYTQDHIRNSRLFQFDPASRSMPLYSVFLQDEITLIPDDLQLTLGSKFEHNVYTGLEVQPSASLLWTPSTQQVFWAAVSRAVRMPSRAERDLTVRFDVAPGTTFTRIPNPGFESIELLAYETGTRYRFSHRISADLALFYNIYEDAAGSERLAPTVTRLGNILSGESYGGELVGRFQAASRWRLEAGYSYLQLQMHREGPPSSSERAIERKSPHHQFLLRSLVDLPGRWEFDTVFRYVDALPHLGIPSYLVMDVRLGWRPTRNLEVSVSGRNLLDKRHPEFRPTDAFLPERSEVEASVFGQISWRF